MNLYLIQHAEAKREEEDPSRDLTDKGLKDISRVAQFVGSLNLRVSQIFHSGKTRAWRTAEVLAPELQAPQGGRPTEGLAPLDDPAIWAGRLAPMTEDTVLVGHLPHLARLAGLLLCGDREKAPITFKMGAVVCLNRSAEGAYAVAWMVTPEMVP
jgi:phosphohistidine phosphatase